MEDEKTPMAAEGEQPWLRIVTGVLEFIGGGLVALHEQDPPAKAREPERSGERDIREQLASLGIRTDQADSIRRRWTSPRTSSQPPTTQAGSIPTLSFEEFAAAVASHLGSAGTPPAPSQAEPSQPAPSPHSDSADERREIDPCAELMDMRLSALESKCRELQSLFAADGPSHSDSQVPVVASEPAAISDAPELSEDREAIASPVEAAPAAGDTPYARRESDGEPKTVVQGPWAATRADAEDGATSIAPSEPSGVYDTHERRVATLESTFESFERLVEGLAARPRGKGPPIG